MTGKTRQQDPGLRATADAAVHRQMRQQSLKTPWQNVAEACEDLIVWRSFALWVRAIVEAEGCLPRPLEQAIDQRCPGFLEARSNPTNYGSIWLDLSAWIDDHFFAAARDGGWIESLYYYSGRDPRSEQIWSYWTRTGAAWREHRPKAYPAFDQWNQNALELVPPAPAHDRLSALVAQYIEWEAFGFWARLIVEHEPELPSDVAAVVEKRCPGFLTHVRSEQPAQVEYSTWFWRELLAWIENHAFAEAKRMSSLDTVRDGARTHLRGERIAEYWADCSARWQKNPPVPYPGFPQWLENADAFVAQVDPKRKSRPPSKSAPQPPKS